MRQLKILQQITNRNSRSLESDFHAVNEKDLINPDEEVFLAKRIREGDTVALERLTQANLRFVISVAKQYDRGIHQMSLGDLISEGNIGLMRAAIKFDETRGFKFISYAVWWIRQAIMSAISEHSRIIRQPMNRVSILNQVIRSSSDLEQKLQRDPTDEEIATALEMPEEHVREIKHAIARPASIDAPIKQDEIFNLLELIEEKDTPAPDEGLMGDSLKTDINTALSKLTTREARILVMFFGLNETTRSTLHDVSLELGITKERVRQLKDCAIEKLKRDANGIDLLRAHLK